MKVMIPRKALRRVVQVAKDNHSQNVCISVSKGKARFEMCDASRPSIELIEIDGIKERDKVEK